MSEASLIPNIPTSEQLPEFVRPVEDVFKCLICHSVLIEAIQTPCGHRMCKLCWSGVIQGQHSAPCPANEDECSVVTKDEVYPDFSARKEISKLKIYCKNKKEGCDTILAWGKLDGHLNGQCRLLRYQCQCGETFSSAPELEQHQKECQKRPPGAHGFNKFEFEKCRTEVQSLNKIMSAVKKRVDLLEKRQRDIMTSTASFGSTVNQLEQLSTNYFKKTDLDHHLAEFQQLKATVQDQGTKLTSLEQRGARGSTDDAFDVLRRHERQLAIVDVRLAEADLRMLSIESTNYSGVLLWKVDNYRRRKEEAVAGRTLSLYSQPFFTSRYGYRMCARVYLNGDGAGRETHLSLFFVVMRGEYDNLLQWPFKQKVTMSLLDQSGGRKNQSDTFRPDPASSSFRKPISEMNVASGCPLFINQSLLEERSFLKDDAIFIKISVDTSDLPAI